MSNAKGPTKGSNQGLSALGLIEAWDTGAYRDVREIWQQAAIQAGDDKFKSELIRGLNALTGHLEYDIGQIRSALAVLSELSSLIERGKRKPNSSSSASVQKKHAVDE